MHVKSKKSVCTYEYNPTLNTPRNQCVRMLAWTVIRGYRGLGGGAWHDRTDLVAVMLPHEARHTHTIIP